MLTDRDLDRYNRQIMMLGEDGQERLKRARVFIAGAGGLGSPISLYLAAAGVGHITLVDRDVVELSNLNRQILHWERDLGHKKVHSAREKLQEMNRDIDIQVSSKTLGEENVYDLVGDADLIIDAMDNYPVRYMLNLTALEKKIPFIHGAVSGFFGQAMTVIPGRSACLRCIFPCAPPKRPFPAVGTTPGIIGMIQANEAIKYITGTGELLSGKLLIWDGLSSQIDIMIAERSPECIDCKEHCV